MLQPTVLVLRLRKVVQLRLLAILAEEDPAMDPEGQGLGDHVVGMRAGGNTEDVVQLLERALLGLRQEQEDEDQRDDVQRGVEAEGARGRHGQQHPRERQRQDRRPEVVRGHRPTHAHLAMGQREDLGGVGERHGAFTGRVEGAEQVDEQGDEAQVCGGVFRDVEAEAGGEQRPEHLREGEEQEGAAAEGVDGPDRRPGEDEVDETEAEG